MIHTKRLFWMIVCLVITPTLFFSVSGCDPNPGGTGGILGVRTIEENITVPTTWDDDIH